MSKPKHILVIRLSAMGDVAMTVPVLRTFAQTYPNVSLTVLTRPFYQPFFDDIPNVEVLEADVYGKHKGLGLFHLARDAKSKGIDAVADLHNVIRSKFITKYLWAMGVRTATLNKGRAQKKKLIKAKGAALTPLKSTHQRYADVFAQLGYPLDLQTQVFPERKPLTSRLHDIMGNHTQKAIGIAPFAAYKSKVYPFELMKDVVKKLDASEKYRIFLFGGGKEEIADLNTLALLFPSVTNVAGKLTIEEELALISNLDLMLSMDSSNGHLAAMFGIPVITLWGVTHPYAGFVPFRQPETNQLLADRSKYPKIPTSVYGNKYPSAYENAMETIAPDRIVTKIKELL
ncbi:glycosyltransferase family 9 protein [Altibacter sp.]|uniref:glycosyltransferase family 9 protein n=1 Tax=Altibacter sp. TaxID=2024823 RepID=UPI002584BA2B|nr:glycosyltransferase family 9 protein [Altibacter sp.]MCW8980250.1 glycosyltransferase family 9 protein [Altibacter sp.]MCW9038024.1 glycosyltransferase family 9 protein [Altibacter sp.]